MSKMEFLDFPNEIICFIGTFLDGKHARNFSECNKRIHDIMAEQIWERPRFDDQEAEILESLSQYNIKELWLNDFIGQLSILHEIKSLQVLVIKDFEDWGIPDLLHFKQCDFKLRLYTSCMSDEKIGVWPENEYNFDKFIDVCKMMELELVLDHGEVAEPWSVDMLKKCKGIRIRRLECMSVITKFWRPVEYWEAVKQLIKDLGIKDVTCMNRDSPLHLQFGYCLVELCESDVVRSYEHVERSWGISRPYELSESESESEMDLFSLVLMP